MRFARRRTVSPRDPVQRTRPEPVAGRRLARSADMVNQNPPLPLDCWSALLHSGATWRVPCWNGACTGRELWATWIGWPAEQIKNHRHGGMERARMSVGRSLFAATLAGMLALTVSPALSQTLRYANQ